MSSSEQAPPTPTSLSEEFKLIAKKSQCAFCLNSLENRDDIFEIKTGRKASNENMPQKDGEAIGFVCGDCVSRNEAKFVVNNQGVPIEIDRLEPLSS